MPPAFDPRMTNQDAVPDDLNQAIDDLAGRFVGSSIATSPRVRAAIGEELISRIRDRFGLRQERAAALPKDAAPVRRRRRGGRAKRGATLPTAVAGKSAGRPSFEDRVSRYLGAQKKGLTVAQLSRRLGMKVQAFEEKLAPLVTTGRVKREGRQLALAG